MKSSIQRANCRAEILILVGFLAIAAVVCSLVNYSLWQGYKGDEENCRTNLWRVDSQHYLFGTMHLPDLYFLRAIPDNVKIALYNSDAAYFEIDPFDSEHHSNETRCGQLGPDVQLSEILPRNLYQRLVKYFEKIQPSLQGMNLSESNWRTMKPYSINLSILP